MRRTLRVCAPLFLLLSGQCTVDTPVPEGAEIRCRSNADCFGQDVCDPLAQRCVASANLLGDTDGDGVSDAFDVCPSGDDKVDRDEDRVPDDCDRCLSGPDSADSDDDSVPDACDMCPSANDGADLDHDGVPDACDRCGLGNDGADGDGDGVPTACDICLLGDDAVDEDADSVPNACDACAGSLDGLDTDLDAVPNGCDVCPSGNDRYDSDGDGLPNACDPCPVTDQDIDSDADGVADGCDACPGYDDANDLDRDTIPDACDACPLGANNLDADDDGVADACDVCPGYDDANPPTVDEPDSVPVSALPDSNCDGVDGIAARAFFVRWDGDDGNAGTRDAPVASIQEAIDRAAAEPLATRTHTHVFIAQGVYPEEVQLRPGVHLYGLYSHDFASRHHFNRTIIASPTGTGLRVDGTSTPFDVDTFVEGLEVQSSQPQTGSSAAVRAINVSGAGSVRLRFVTLAAGTGVDGAEGQSGADGLTGQWGEDGGSNEGTPAASGGGAIDYARPVGCRVYLGGRGGDGASGGGWPAGQAGAPGAPSAPPGGAGGNGPGYVYPPQVEDGQPAVGNASHGNNATARAASTQRLGSVSGNDWVAGVGADGASAGGAGFGGGGGQGGASDTGCYGAGGGGGGAGGCGGAPGQGGRGGGGSFAVMAFSSTKLVIERSVLRSGSGGRGGVGGSGGLGGLGGYGGSGGVNNGVCLASDGRGGGRGSDGGMGGAAQGGGGGASAALFCWPTGSACTTFLSVASGGSAQNTTTVGQGGRGGPPGFSVSGYPTRSSGADGVSQVTFDAP